jgi:hypothetical protein
MLNRGGSTSILWKQPGEIKWLSYRIRNARKLRNGLQIQVGGLFLPCAI